MNDLDKYIKKQKRIGIIMAVVSIVLFIVTLVVFILLKIKGDFVWYMLWYMFIPMAIFIGMAILGIGWYVMINKTGRGQ